MSLSPGELIAERFRIVRLLGEGGMGAVYEAEQVGLGRRVALKVMHPHIATAPGFAERFQREAQVLARLRHPGSVEVYDSGLDQGVLYLAMEQVSGETLETLVQREGALPVARAVGLMVQVLEVLEAAHALGIVHRDLKPANLFLEPHPQGERVKVLDFGLASLEGPENARLTQEGMAVGTPGFMSPEQMRGQPLDGRSDLYAVGCVLYELLAGTAPFPPMPSAEMAVAHLYKPVPPLRSAFRGLSIPESLESVVMKAVEKLPGSRPADATSMRRALLAVLQVPVGGGDREAGRGGQEGQARARAARGDGGAARGGRRARGRAGGAALRRWTRAGEVARRVWFSGTGGACRRATHGVRRAAGPRGRTRGPAPGARTGRASGLSPRAAVWPLE